MTLFIPTQENALMYQEDLNAISPHQAQKIICLLDLPSRIALVILALSSWESISLAAPAVSGVGDETETLDQVRG